MFDRAHIQRAALLAAPANPETNTLRRLFGRNRDINISGICSGEQEEKRGEAQF